MALFEIKNRWNGEIIFTLECGSMKLCVEAAIGAKADLYGANLRSANLRSANLYGANLYGADLYGANLRSANLYGANLYGANLYGADLRSADLRSADLYGADLRSADLYGADLYGADLRSADLYGADLRSADLGEDTILAEHRPLLQLGPIGSRNDYLLAFNTNKGIKIRAGCFFGGIDEFSEAVNKTHGDNRHGSDYGAAIALVRTMMAKIEEPVT